MPPDGDRSALVRSAAEACHVRPHHILDMYPCTPFQEGVLALTAGDRSAYVQHTELKVSDGADLDRVFAAWDSVIASNPILRTRIVQSDNGASHASRRPRVGGVAAVRLIQGLPGRGLRRSPWD